MEINGNIEKLCNKNLDRDQAGHVPVGLVSIAQKLWEQPIKKRRYNNILDFGITVVCCFAITLIWVFELSSEFHLFKFIYV